MAHGVVGMYEDYRDDPNVPGFLWTYSGRRFWPLDPRAQDVDIVDIAHALSFQCRYGGHVRAHYSVAQHCVLVAENCDHPLLGLIHDAAEAYMIDLPKTIKRDPVLKARWEEIDGAIHRAICESLNVTPVISDDVKHADLVVARTEMRDVMAAERPLVFLGESVAPLPRCITPWPAEVAKEMFLQRYVEYEGQVLNRLGPDRNP
jgi:hypothetical protein